MCHEHRHEFQKERMYIQYWILKAHVLPLYEIGFGTQYFMLIRYLVGLTVLLTATRLLAEPFVVAKNLTMSGYTFNDYRDFQKNWKLVTVRYRKDTDEMRFTYANDLAYSTLMSGKTDYPDGAVFAKIGFKTEPDPAFSSSAVPSGIRRYQFMVRDSKKHTSTNGWG